MIYVLEKKLGSGRAGAATYLFFDFFVVKSTMVKRTVFFILILLIKTINLFNSYCSSVTLQNIIVL